MPTVEDDVAFGPRNMMLPEEEVERRVSSALEAVGCMEWRKHSLRKNCQGATSCCGNSYCIIYGTIYSYP